MVDKNKAEEEGFAEKLVDDLKQREEALKISVKEASSYSLMDGFGLRYITPYALALQLSKLQIGLLSSLPALLANFSQIFTPKLMEKHSRKKIVFLGMFLQSLMWLILIGIGIGFFYLKWNREISSSSFVIAYTILILFGTLTGPAWSSWMKDLTEGVKSGEFFGRRSKVAGIVALVCMLIGGLILDYSEHFNLFIGFVILLSLAFLGRLGSSLLIKKQYEPKWDKKEGYYFSFIDFVKQMHRNNYGKFVLTTASMAFAMSISGPFFPVYMLENLKFSYVQFTIVTMCSAAIALIVMQKWGRFADKYGNLKVIKISGLLIAFLPLLWIVSSFFINSGRIVFLFLIFVAFVEGFSGAGYNLSVGNFIYDSVSKGRMALCVAYFSILHGVFAFIGATLGGFLASRNLLFGINSLLIVFGISFVLRIGALIFINKNIKEVREVKTFTGKEAREEFRSLSPLTSWNFLDNRLFKNRPY